MAQRDSRFPRVLSAHLRRWLAVAALTRVVAPSAIVGAQCLPIPQGTSPDVIVAGAETEGRLYRRVVEAKDSVARSCVTGWDIGPATSGEFTIGGQISSFRPLRAGKVGKIWWKPLKAAADMPALIVRGRNLSNARDSVRYRTTRIAWSGSPGTPVPPSQRSYFFRPASPCRRLGDGS
jgi:hypothetical protein